MNSKNMDEILNIDTIGCLKENRALVSPVRKTQYRYDRSFKEKYNNCRSGSKDLTFKYCLNVKSNEFSINKRKSIELSQTFLRTSINFLRCHTSKDFCKNLLSMIDIPFFSMKIWILKICHLSLRKISLHHWPPGRSVCMSYEHMIAVKKLKSIKISLINILLMFTYLSVIGSVVHPSVCLTVFFVYVQSHVNDIYHVPQQFALQHSKTWTHKLTHTHSTSIDDDDADTFKIYSSRIIK